jgi:hypothetical protein
MYSEIASFLMLIKDSDRVISFNCYIALFNTAEYGCSMWNSQEVLHFIACETSSCPGFKHSCPQQAKFDQSSSS